MPNKKLWPAVALTLAIVVAFAALLWPTEPDSRLRSVQPTPRKILTQVGETYSPETASFSVQFKEVVSPYRVVAGFVMPGETMALEVHTPEHEDTFVVEAEGGEIDRVGETAWRWHAPDIAGHYPIHIDERRSGESITINAFVMVPYDQDDEYLRGYRIGQYKREPYRGDSAYMPPQGFVEVTPENRDVLVSPHFTLGQFLCKQESTYPKFVLVQESLILKLEMLLREINKRGLAVPTLHIMSAFRTPYYNRSIGNETDYSSHLYGGAADVFVDVDGDGYMDDLTDDNAVTREDAVFLARIVEAQAGVAGYQPFIGGLGIYSPAPHRGPFVHLDVRGTTVRW